MLGIHYLGQLQRYSLTRLSKSLGRSALETSAAENGVLKMMMLELLKSHKTRSALAGAE